MGKSWSLAPLWMQPQVGNGLIAVVLGQRRVRAVRRFIGVATLLIGAAGMILLPSDGLNDYGNAVVLTFAASTVPVSLVWFTRAWSGRYDWLFLLYADIGIVAVLSVFESPFDALPGAALLSIVSLFALVLVSRAAFISHTLYAVAVAIWLAAGALEETTDPWLVVSRFLTISALLAAPLAVQMYLGQLYRQIARAQNDRETGLFNRLGLESTLGVREPPPGQSATLLAVSVTISDFENLGRKFGRAVQRAAVVETTELLRGNAHHGDVIARTAPGDFVICRWKEVSDDLVTTLHDFEGRLAEHRLSTAPIALSCGVATVSGSATARGAGSAWMVQRALDAAELRRRSNVQEFQGKPRSTREMSERIADRVRTLISAGGPAIAFQPIFKAADLGIAGYEALSRFPNTTSTTEQWFADATAVGLGPDLERAAILGALAASKTLPPDAFLALNVSAATLLTADMPELLLDVQHRQIVVELTEHEDAQHYPALRSVLNRLRQSGVQIALDDVGSGYAGIRQLVDLVPDILKLDAFIVRGSHTDIARRAAAEAIVTFAHRTEARCVFEGIETAEDLESARALGAHLVQGFYLAHPELASPHQVGRESGGDAVPRRRL